MKNHFPFLLAALLLLAVPLRAQDAAGEKGFELRLGVAGLPSGAFLASGSPWVKADADIDPYYYWRHDRYTDRYGALKSFGTLTLDALWHLNRHHAVGVGAGFDFLAGSLYDGYTGEKRFQPAFGLSLWPQWRMIWNPDRAVRLYSSVALGAGAYYGVHDVDEWSYIPVIQLVPTGFSFGRGPVSGFVEMTFGTLSLGGRAGVAWAF